MSLDAHFSQLARRIEPAAIRKVMALASAPDVIAFTGGKPAPNLFPLEAIRQKTSTVLDEHGPESLQYASTDGYLPLRQWVAGRLPGDIKAENLMIISGSQQAIDLVGRVFIDPGDKVVVAAPTYTAALTTLRVYGPEFLEVECDGDGMLPESLEAALQQGVKLIYAVPNFMNPTGVDMSRERRQQLADLARQYDVPVLEDDPYGDLRFEGETPPNVYELAPDRTIYAGTFSKILMPGLRLGWLTGPPVA
ncbi:MAG: PLP-dependent aminotransferase family protein, partial [Anaerolineales bacterium]|nr:PLP-dependent aminotransferase family protein [Anaerolineales bacterium]